MIIKIKKDVIYRCQEGTEDIIIGSLYPSATEEDERIIECGTEVLPEVHKFIEDVNSGSFKPRSIVKALEKVIAKYA